MTAREPAPGPALAPSSLPGSVAYSGSGSGSASPRLTCCPLADGPGTARGWLSEPLTCGCSHARSQFSNTAVRHSRSRGLARGPRVLVPRDCPRSNASHKLGYPGHPRFHLVGPTPLPRLGNSRERHAGLRKPPTGVLPSGRTESGPASPPLPAAGALPTRPATAPAPALSRPVIRGGLSHPGLRGSLQKGL